MGKPDCREDYDTAIPDPSQNTAEEIEEWERITLSYGLVYGDAVVQFNAEDKVVSVKTPAGGSR